MRVHVFSIFFTCFVYEAVALAINSNIAPTATSSTNSTKVNCEWREMWFFFSFNRNDSNNSLFSFTLPFTMNRCVLIQWISSQINSLQHTIRWKTIWMCFSFHLAKQRWEIWMGIWIHVNCRFFCILFLFEILTTFLFSFTHSISILSVYVYLFKCSCYYSWRVKMVDRISSANMAQPNARAIACNRVFWTRWMAIKMRKPNLLRAKWNGTLNIPVEGFVCQVFV